jgi:hypothetical protein
MTSGVFAQTDFAIPYRPVVGRRPRAYGDFGTREAARSRPPRSRPASLRLAEFMSLVAQIEAAWKGDLHPELLASHAVPLALSARGFLFARTRRLIGVRFCVHHRISGLRDPLHADHDNSRGCIRTPLKGTTECDRFAKSWEGRRAAARLISVSKPICYAKVSPTFLTPLLSVRVYWLAPSTRRTR